MQLRCCGGYPENRWYVPLVEPIGCGGFGWLFGVAFDAVARLVGRMASVFVGLL